MYIPTIDWTSSYPGYHIIKGYQYMVEKIRKDKREINCNGQQLSMEIKRKKIDAFIKLFLFL